MSIHNLTQSKWQRLTLAEQMGNIGSEFLRFRNLNAHQDKDAAEKSAERFLELLDLTIASARGQSRLAELLKLREFFCDFYAGTNFYSGYQELEKYFIQFALLARK